MPLVGIARSLAFTLDEVGIDRIHDHSRYLNDITRSSIRDIVEHMNAGRTDVVPMRGDHHLLVAPVAEGAAPRITQQLAERDVDVRYLDDNHIRISLGFWTSDDDIAALASELTAIA